MNLMQHGQPEYMMGPTGMMVQDAVAAYPSEGSLENHMSSYGQVMIPGYAPTQHGFIPMVYCAPQYGQWSQGPYADYGMVSMLPEAGPYYTIDSHGNYVLIQPTGADPNKLIANDSKGNDGNKENMPLKSGPGGDAESRPDTLPSDPSPSFFGASAGRPFIPGIQPPIFGIRRPFPPNQPGRRNNATYKTMMCTMFTQSGECNYGVRCQYAHGQEELRVVAPHPKFKTQMCNKYNSATGCQYGDKCHFRHPNDPIPEFTSSMTSGRQYDQRFRKFERIGKGGYEKRVPADKSNSNQTTTSIKTAASGVPCKEKCDEKVGDHFKKTKEHFRNAFSGNNILDQLNEKNKECFISLSMYHHFEVYVGKNKKVSTLKRSNSLNTVGSFTFQRFVAMREIIKTEVNRLKPKGSGKNENTRLKSHNISKAEEKSSPVTKEEGKKNNRKNSKASPRPGNKKKHH